MTAMNVIEAICSRRSVRKFESRPIEPKVVDELLRCAMHAPSAGDEEPWHFIVVDDAKILGVCAELNPYAFMAESAPLGILVCGDTTLERFPGNWPLDCSAATQNLLLACQAHNLGSVWTGIYPEKDRVDAFRKQFRLPATVIPLALVLVGYPSDMVLPRSAYKPERIHRNNW